jgi:uncharacterized cupredoxin-like copper-binding protein
MEKDMKKIFFSMLAFALVITACGGTASTPIPSVNNAPTPEATTQAAQNADGKVQVQVTEGDNWIKSDMTTFKVGVPYVFTITNTGRHAHIFSISQPADKTASGIDTAKKGALVFISDEQLSPGAVVTVEHTFTEPAPAGTLEFACLILMHYKMGQYLPIVVE